MNAESEEIKTRGEDKNKEEAEQDDRQNVGLTIWEGSRMDI